LKCLECGEENKEGELYCVNCKHKLPGADELLIKAQNGLINNVEATKKIKRFRMIYVLLTIVLCLLIGYIGLRVPYCGCLTTIVVILVLRVIPFFKKYDILTETYSKEVMYNYKKFIIDSWRKSKVERVLFCFFLLQMLINIVLVVVLLLGVR